MNKPLTMSVKLTILIVFALAFGATMIALSVKRPSLTEGDSYGWGSDKKIEKTFSVQPDGKLVIDSDEGNITVAGTNGNEVTVHVTARGSEEKLAKFNVTLDQVGDVVRVEGKFKRKYFNFFNNNSFDVHFDVQVPNHYNLDVRTSGGNIAVQHINGKIVGETSGGDLTLSDVDGQVEMSTSGGEVEVRKASGNFRLETSGGNMRAESIAGTIHMETSGGNIELRDSDGKLYASTSGGNIRAALKDNKGIDLSTSGGNLTVRLPKSISADVHAEATGGDINCDFPFSGKLKDGTMNAKINGGGNLIKLETSGGDIEINPVE